MGRGGSGGAAVLQAQLSAVLTRTISACWRDVLAVGGVAGGGAAGAGGGAGVGGGAGGGAGGGVGGGVAQPGMQLLPAVPVSKRSASVIPVPCC